MFVGIALVICTKAEASHHDIRFPEQLLIAQLYPRVYIFKLFPKRSGGVRDVSALQNAMRGNVCTYDHNMDAISAMVEGQLMPRPPTI